MGLILFLLALILVAVCVVALVHIAASTKPAPEKIMWVAVVVCFPVLGPIAYYVVGRDEL